MLTRRHLLKWFAALNLPNSRWAGDLAGVPDVGGPDAAPLYLEAFEQFGQLGPDALAILNPTAKWSPDDPLIPGLIRRSRPALDLLRRAGRLDACRWNDRTVTLEDLGEGALDGVNARRLIRLACLSSHFQFEAGRVAGCLDDAFAALVFAHRLGSGGVLIARVYECGAEVDVFRLLGRLLPRFDRPLLGDLSSRLDALPGPEPASATIGPESRFILGSIRTKVERCGPTLKAEDWDEIGLESDQVRELVEITGNDRGRLLAHLDASRLAFDELARRIDLPRPEVRDSLDAFERENRARFPIVACVVDAALGVRHVVDRMKALRTMLRAGIALMLGGEEGFRKVQDPFGAGPFAIEDAVDGKGRMIRSSLLEDGRPPFELLIGGG